MGFRSLLPAVSKTPRAQVRQSSQIAVALTILRSSLSISSWLLLGGVVQGALLLLLPYWWVLAPALFVLAARFGHTVLITLKLVPNPYLKDVIPEWVSGQIPNADGEYSDTPASEQVAVLHLGAKYNHPMGAFAPYAKHLNDYAGNMYKELDSEGKKINGYLGGHSYTTFDERGALELTFISYWRSIEAIHDFAYSPAHRAGWEWWNSVPKDEIRHLGINHEIFLARSGEWETIYLNHQPTMLMGTHSYRKGDKEMGGVVEDSWLTNAIAARGKLRTSAGRLNRSPESLAEKHHYVPKPVNGEVDNQRNVQST